MKKTIVIVGHPHLDKSVVSKFWCEQLTGKVTLRYLAETCPLDKPIDIIAEQAVLEQHDRIILQFPLYWYSAPAIMKRWLDEIMTFGWAYGPGGDKLEGKDLGVAVSAGSPDNEFQEGAMQLHTLHYYLEQYRGTAAFIRANWIGVHAFFDTFSPSVHENLQADMPKYIRFIEQE